MRGGHNFVDITGYRYSFLTVIKIHKKEKYGVYWLCRCDCGQCKTILGQHLKSKKTQSCGCHRKKSASENNFIHGHSLTGKTQTKEYKSWLDMKARCANKKNRFYPNYGGRGIMVCDRWLNSFENFLSDMGKKPNESYTLDRMNNNGNYEPSNCRWATRKEQNRNTRSNKMLTKNGTTKSMAEWSEILGINYSTIRARKRRGFSDEQALIPA
jgi:hypothetical protein